MRWESVTATLGYAVYALWNDNRKLATLVFNPSSSAARIEYEGGKRVFLIRKEGFRKNKTVLRNEYGMHIGQAGSENNDDFIELNGQRFYYSLEENGSPAVTIYKESKEQPLAICGWDVKRKDVLGVFRNTRIDENTHYILLMMLCWYLSQPVDALKPARALELA